MSEPTVVVHDDPDQLASSVAARLLARLAEVQSSRGEASLVLTGGSIARRIYAAVADSPERDTVDWSRLDVWWGDERFLPSRDSERNETLAHETLLDRVPVDPGRVHPMPPSDGPDGDDPDAGAARYVEVLARAAKAAGTGDHGHAPAFDVCLLGVGPDGHIASLFPGHPALADERPALPVRESPKPPPVRISLSLPVINGSREIWCVVAGEDKADAVAQALSGAEPAPVPAAAASGRDRTLWLLDRAAAGKLPDGLAGTASP